MPKTFLTLIAFNYGMMGEIYLSGMVERIGIYAIYLHVENIVIQLPDETVPSYIV